MSNRFPLGASLALALAASFAAIPQAAEAFSVVHAGTTYDIEIYSGSYDSQPQLFATPENQGRMPWWGNPDLADQLANQLAAGLSLTPYPNNGPLFATAFAAVNSGSEVTSSYFDLTSFGITNLVTSAEFSRDQNLSYVVTTASVPVPIPYAATALCISATRRLRRLSSRLKMQGLKPGPASASPFSQ